MEKRYLFLGLILIYGFGSSRGQNPCTLPNPSESVGDFSLVEPFVYEQETFFLWTKHRIFYAYRKKGDACELLLQDTLEVPYKEPLTEGNRMLFKDLDQDGKPELLIEVAFSEFDTRYTTTERSFYFKVYAFEKGKNRPNVQIIPRTKLVVLDLKIVPKDSVHFFWKQREYKAFYKQQKIEMSPQFRNQFNPQQPIPESRRIIAVGGLMVIVVLLIAYAFQAWQVMAWIGVCAFLLLASVRLEGGLKENPALLRSPVRALATLGTYQTGSKGSNGSWNYYFNYQGKQITNRVTQSPLPNHCMAPGSQFPVWFEQEHPANAEIDWWAGNCKQ
jgi:hypothetical protein